MNLFKTSKLAGRLQHVKLLKDDRAYDTLHMVRIKHGRGDVTLVRIGTRSSTPEYGQAGARDCYLGEDEHNRRIDYYLKELGFKTQFRVRKNEFGFLNAVKL